MKNMKFGHLINIAYALAATFAVVGSVVRPGDVPLTILIVVVLMWTTAQIIRAGALSAFALLHDEEDKRNS